VANNRDTNLNKLLERLQWRLCAKRLEFSKLKFDMKDKLKIYKSQTTTYGFV